MIVSAGFKDQAESKASLKKKTLPNVTVPIVHKSQVKREVSKSRGTAREEHTKNLQPVKALFYDGRKDKTFTVENIGEQKRSITVVEHIVLIQEPGGQYIGHITLIDGSAAAIKEAIEKYCLEVTVPLCRHRQDGIGAVLSTRQVGWPTSRKAVLYCRHGIIVCHHGIF